MAPECRIRLGLNRTTKVLAGVALTLVMLSVAGQIVRFTTSHGNVYGLINLFNIEAENNIPSFFSATLLLLASLLVGITAVLKAKARAPFAKRWAGLAFGFLYLAVDEAASIHELWVRPTREMLGEHASGIFYFAWVVPGILLVAAVAIIYFRFWLHLPSAVRRYVLLAAMLYLGGALGVELLTGRFVESYGMANVTYAVLTTIEESLEMAGVILFVYAIQRYLERSYGAVQFCLSS